MRIGGLRSLCLILLAAGWSAALAVEAPGRAAIASPHPLATAAGEEILAAGGNAFDAAVAVSAALAVVEPYGSGLGGGGFWLLHRQEDGLQVMVDGRETAPGAAHADMYLDEHGEPIPGLSRNGPMAAGIPGSPAALVHITNEYGRLPLEEVLAPAIRFAEQGVEVYPRMLQGLRGRQDLMLEYPGAAEVFFPGGELPEVGQVLRQTELAATLQSLAEQGRDGFYRGPVAEALVAGVREAGGIWTLEDLANYTVVEREPVRIDYHDTRIVAASLPSSGGIVLAITLAILEQFDLEAMSDAERHHLIIEAMRRAFRDRALYLGDPDFITVPEERLTHRHYGAGLAAAIRLDRATPSDMLPGIVVDGDPGTQTTHFSVLDAEGNRVAATMSLNSWYGSGFMPPGTGVLLNNEMDDFSTRPGVPDLFGLVTAEANAIQPGKRMLSSMTPTFVESPRGLAVLGSPGGPRIITTVLLGALAWLDGAEAGEIVEQRRYHHQYLPDAVTHEAGAFDEEVAEALRARGHTLRERGDYGNLQVVTWEYETGRVDAASDPRGETGDAQVY